jgi:hypothetical protein
LDRSTVRGARLARPLLTVGVDGDRHMACPHLKEVVMLFCDAYPARKMLPLDRIVTADPCLGQFLGCPVYQECRARFLAEQNGGTAASTDPPARAAKEVSR